MKKIIVAVSLSCIMGILPLSSNATTFSGRCGDPNNPVTQPPGETFCGCFDTQVIQGCQQRGLPPPSCTVSRIKDQIKSIGIPLTCSKYPPAGVGTDECTVDVNFFLANC